MCSWGFWKMTLLYLLLFFWVECLNDSKKVSQSGSTNAKMINVSCVIFYYGAFYIFLLYLCLHRLHTTPFSTHKKWQNARHPKWHENGGETEMNCCLLLMSNDSGPEIYMTFHGSSRFPIVYWIERCDGHVWIRSFSKNIIHFNQQRL